MYQILLLEARFDMADFAAYLMLDGASLLAHKKPGHIVIDIGKPFHLDRIRARRAKPGLMPQHLKAVQTAAEIGDARVLGARVGSMALDKLTIRLT